ncbi:hypothetical protein N7462_007970 [Penicillium macrosclerotiorum]|uniref:uncharacterized protein n=1 Tax=Penicillium macrosclerotiorum TaxID=303699 RepID=UPI002546CD4D|nr:uncharacterized protein N7462_007970 [Penicillium macrosclerotiorum]KAJ5679726.1 hypothetical protein N7462_007970 [Penicillium macrosclerotiorum]
MAVRHGDAAVSLQRAWYPDPQSLPFARHIKTHALVSLVQKGLQYHELESSIDKVCVFARARLVISITLASASLLDLSIFPKAPGMTGNPINFTPSEYFFGPDPFEVNALKNQVEADAEEAPVSEPARDRVTNGHPAEVVPGKKSRKREANGDESMEVDEAESKGGSPAPDVDGDGDVSMGTADDVPPEPTATTGNSTGVQIPTAKSADLAPDTALVKADGHVMITSWRPRDPTTLVVAGDIFCSLWKLSLSSTPVQKTFLDLKGTGAYVSSLAWDGAGTKLAVATTRDTKGTVTMYNSDGNVVDLLPDLPRVINGLYWAKESPQLVIVASDEQTTELALWDDSRRPDVYPPPQAVENPIYDLAWCGRNLVFACGGGSVYQCEVDQNIRLTKTYASPDPNATWTFIRATSVNNNPVAVTASDVSATIWIPTHDMTIQATQHEIITAIDIRAPSPTQAKNSNSITICAYSVTGTVKVWHVDLDSKQHTRIHTLNCGSASSALVGGFSPDGYALSAVSKDRLFIWNAERGGEPMATWSAPKSEPIKAEPDHPANGQNGHVAPNPERALSWDPDGKKLAFGFGNQVRRHADVMYDLPC